MVLLDNQNCQPISECQMRVYYLTETQFGLSNLALRRLKVARFADLNDPFELLALDLGSRNLRIGISAKKKQINNEQGLVCFSRSWRDPLLWSHYGEKHRGLCLGFDVPDAVLKQVAYVKGLQKVDVASPATPQHVVTNLLDRLRYTKFDGWKYEDEVRRFVDLRTLKPQGGLYFLPFSDELVPREVILGSRSALPIETVREFVQSFSPPIRVMRSRIAFTKFAVVEDRSSRIPRG